MSFDNKMGYRDQIVPWELAGIGTREFRGNMGIGPGVSRTVPALGSHAFFQERRRCGALNSIIEDGRVWMTCEYGARLSLRVSRAQMDKGRCDRKF